MGRTVRFDQIYVSRLDIDPSELNQTSLGGITVGDISSDNISTTRVAISGRIDGINEFEVSDTFVINTANSNLVTANGNVLIDNGNLYINGGIITNPEQASSIKYSNTFSIQSGGGQDVQIVFRPGTFYAKVVALLRNDGDVNSTSTMILELQGGTHDGTTPSSPITVGTTNIFGKEHPWSAIVKTGTRGVNIRPYYKDTTHNYSYDILIEVLSSVGGGVSRITNNIGEDYAKLNDGVGGTDKVTFSY